MAESLQNFLLEVDQIRQEQEGRTTDPAALTTQDAPVEGQYVPKTSDVDYSEDVRKAHDARSLSDSLRTVETLRKEDTPPKDSSSVPDEGFYEPGMFSSVGGFLKRTVVGGVRDAVQETMEATEDFAEFMNANVADFSKLQTEKINLPEVDDPEGVVEGIGKGIVQFLTGFLPAFKAAKVASAGTTLGRIAGTEAVAAGTTTFVFDPHEDRLSNLIQEFPRLKNPVTEYLAAASDDTKAEGRFKNALEGLGLGIGFEGVVKGMSLAGRAIKANREARGVAREAPIRTPDVSVAKEIGTPEQPPVVVQKASKKEFGLRVVQDIVDGDEFDIRIMDGDKEVATVVGEFVNGEAIDISVQRERGTSQFTPEQFASLRAQVEELTGPIDLNKSQDVRRAFADLAQEELARQGLEEVPVERLTRAAVQVRGKTFVGENHTEALNKAVEIFGDAVDNEVLEDSFGYVTSNRRFVNQDEAVKIGTAANQIKKLQEVAFGKGLASQNIDFRVPASTTISSKAEGKPFVQPAVRINFGAVESGKALDISIDATAELFSKASKKETLRMSQEAIASIANNLGVSVNDLTKANRSQNWTPQQIIAAQRHLAQSTNDLGEMANRLALSTDDVDFYMFMKLRSTHLGLIEKLKGNPELADKIIRRVPTLDGSKANQLEQINTFIAESGGRGAALKFANAVKGFKSGQELNKALNKSIGQRVTDAIVSMWYFNLLSGFRTHAVNVTSAGLTTSWNVPARFLAAGISKARGTSRNSVQFGEATQLVYGITDSMKQSLRMIGRSIRDGNRTALIAGQDPVSKAIKGFGANKSTDVVGRLDQAEQMRGISAENFGLASAAPGSIGHFFGKSIDTADLIMSSLSSRPLIAGDEFFRTIGINMETRALALRDGISQGLEGRELARFIEDTVRNPPNDIATKSLSFARDNLMTTPLGETGRGIQKVINRHPTLKFIAPFVRVGVNLLKWSGKNTPLGALNSSIRKDIAKGGAEGDIALARMAMGGSAMMAIGAYAMEGRITGAGPSANSGLRETWMQTHKPFSVRVHDTGDLEQDWVSYNRLDPFGIFLGVSASFGELYGQMEFEDSGEMVMAALSATSRSIFGKTWMSSITDFVEMMHNPEENSERWLQKFAGTASVPNAVAQFTSGAVDPVWRDVQSVHDSIISRVPGMSDQLPPNTNIWGDPILFTGALGPDLVSPLYRYNTEATPIDNWLWENQVSVKNPKRTQRGVELTPHEFFRFKQLAGNELKNPVTGLGLRDTLNAIMAGQHLMSNQWIRGTDGPDGMKALIVKEQINNFREAALNEMAKENEAFKQKIVNKQREDFINVLGFRAPF